MSGETRLRQAIEKECIHSMDWVDHAISNPEWHLADRVLDWRNYIPQVTRDIWDQFDTTAKLALFLSATIAASCEEWD